MTREIWHRLFFGFATLVAAVVAAGDASFEAGKQQLELDAKNASRIRVRIPAGDIHIEGIKGDQIYAKAVVRCKDSESRCTRAAEKLEWTTREDDKEIALRLGPGPSFSDTDVKVEVQVPADRDLVFDIDAGEIRIVGMRGCVNGHVDAGDVRIVMAADPVASVHLDTDFGDASLRTPGASMEGDRSWLVGAVVNWDGGEGNCHVDVSLNAGDLRLDLQ